MKKCILVASFLFPAFAFAEASTYTVSGMTCKTCVKAVKAKVCKIEGVEKCEVSIGKVVLTPKAGATLKDLEVSQAIEKAGEYKVTGSPANQ
jgi:mercuric ion binding protein